MRDAARRGALGIHPGGRRGGELQTLPGVTGRCSCSSVTENLEAAGSRSRVRVEKLRSAASKSRMCVLTAVISLKERNNTTTSKCGGEKAKFAAAHFCARWPCFGARVLGPLIWSRPRESVKLRAALCYHSGRLPQPNWSFAGSRGGTQPQRVTCGAKVEVPGRREFV